MGGRGLAFRALCSLMRPVDVSSCGAIADAAWTPLIFGLHNPAFALRLRACRLRLGGLRVGLGLPRFTLPALLVDVCTQAGEAARQLAAGGPRLDSTAQANPSGGGSAWTLVRV